MCRELDRKPVVRAAVLAGNETFDNNPCPNVQSLDLIERRGIEIFRVGGIGCGHESPMKKKVAVALESRKSGHTGVTDAR